MATKTLDQPANSGPGASATKRRYGYGTVAVHTTLASCDVIDIRDYRDIGVKPPTGVTALVVYAAETVDGTFVLVDNIGTNGSVTMTAERWFTLDTTKIGPYGFIKLQSAGATGNAAVAGKT